MCEKSRTFGKDGLPAVGIEQEAVTLELRSFHNFHINTLHNFIKTKSIPVTGRGGL
jgi:hypothetical protein